MAGCVDQHNAVVVVVVVVVVVTIADGIPVQIEGAQLAVRGFGFEEDLDVFQCFVPHPVVDSQIARVEDPFQARILLLPAVVVCRIVHVGQDQVGGPVRTGHGFDGPNGGLGIPGRVDHDPDHRCRFRLRRRIRRFRSRQQIGSGPEGFRVVVANKIHVQKIRRNGSRKGEGPPVEFRVDGQLGAFCIPCLLLLFFFWLLFHTDGGNGTSRQCGPRFFDFLFRNRLLRDDVVGVASGFSGKDGRCKHAASGTIDALVVYVEGAIGVFGKLSRAGRRERKLSRIAGSLGIVFVVDFVVVVVVVVVVDDHSFRSDDTRREERVHDEACPNSGAIDCVTSTEQSRCPQQCQESKPFERRSIHSCCFC
mmetsp:Transcript_11393/g.26417  ORF Transcript_11393/g.26417 Transcript_11393/m.26417 type:complete len:364 (+) Transcript_11393:1720-2811(+)